MGRRKAVPAELHHELSEYTSLLRALRTTDTLDLASQLTKSAGPPRTSPVCNPTAQPTNKSKAKEKEKENWTRWPLLLGDFAAPEFTFEDEVRALAAEALLIQRKYEEAPQEDTDLPQTQSLSQTSEQEEEEEAGGDPEDLPESHFSALTLATSTHLTQILAALASHIPHAEKSMQNRLKPLGWQSVLEIMAATRCCSPE